MSTTRTWLLAGAAIALIGGGVAVAQDAKPDAKDEQRVERDVRVYRFEDGPQSFVIERGGRDGDRQVRIERRRRDGDRTVRVFRDGDHDVHVMHAGGGREQHLKDVLQLRPNQEPALKAFLEATAPDRARDRVVRFDRDGGGRNTAERLAEMEAQFAQQQAGMRRRIDATKAFYAQLDERQRKAFDAMPMLMMAGPGFGPMLLPGPMSIVHRMPLPPEPPMPPAAPPPPRAPRS
jgi:hypothetical protein